MITSKEILQAIADHLGLTVEDLERHSHLREDLGLGPIELSDLLNYLGVKFNITFNPEEVEDLHAVEDLVAMVEDNLIE